MKHTLSRDEFIRGVLAVRPEQLSAEALGAIYDYYVEVCPDIEYDPIDVFCEWTECAIGELPEVLASLGAPLDEDPVDWLGEQTTVLRLDGGKVVFMNF